MSDERKPNATGPTGPRTPEGKARSSRNAFRHGLTGQRFVFTDEEAPAYREHHAAIAAYYKPFGPIETSLVDAIAVGIWRLQRAAAIEQGIFTEEELRDSEAADPRGPAAAWQSQAKFLDLLGKYERRLRRALEKDKNELAEIQSARKQQVVEDMKVAVSLHRLAVAEGRTYDPTEYFTDFEPIPGLANAPEIVASISERRAALAQAKIRIEEIRKQPRAA